MNNRYTDISKKDFANYWLSETKYIKWNIKILKTYEIIIVKIILNF